MMNKEVKINIFDRYFAQQPIKIFLLLSLLSGLVGAFLYWLVGFWTTGSWMPPPQEDIAAPVAIVLGTAAAFSGSLVAIVIASHAVDLQRHQNAREDDQAVREDVQARLEVLRLLSAETSTFLKPYAQLLQTVRNLTAIMEINNDLFWHEIDKRRVRDPSYLQDPDIKDFLIKLDQRFKHVAKALKDVSENLATLQVESHSNAFGYAVFGATFGQQSVELKPGWDQSKVPFTALPTICTWLNFKAERLTALTGSEDSETPHKDLLERLAIARMLANVAKCHDGTSFDNLALRGFLLLGFMLEETNHEDLQSGRDIRPAITELIYQIATAYSPDSVQMALCRIFEDQPIHIRQAAKDLVKLTPSPIDEVMKDSILAKYGALRPRVRLVGEQFA